MQATATRPVILGRKAIHRLSTRELQKLSLEDRSIQALTVLWTFGVLASTAAIATGTRVPGFEDVPEEGQALFVLFGALTAVGCHRRAAWARVCGVFLCLAMILSSYPPGIWIGVAGLVVLACAGRLFGQQRYDGAMLRIDLEARGRFRLPRIPLFAVARRPRRRARARFVPERRLHF